MKAQSINNTGQFCDQCHTRHYCIASRLQKDDVKRLAEVMDFGHRVGRHEYLFAMGDSISHQFHVRSGMFKSYTINTEGDESVTGFYLPGDVVPNFQTDGCSLHTVAALEESSVCYVPVQAEGGVSSVWQALAFQAYEATSSTLTHQLNVKATSAQARFAGFCIQMMQRLAKLDRDPTHIPTPMSRTDIASYLGLTLESLSRVFARMKRSGVIAADRQHIKITDPATLSTLALHIS